MTELYNKKEQTLIRKKLRKEMPSAEKVLWAKIRKKQINNYRFRRQYSIGKFVVDFYCRELRLAIEIDGGSHFINEQAENRDLVRQKFIESNKIKFLRFTNSDIYYHLENVLEMIYEHINKLPLPNPPLIKGRENE